MGFFACRQVTLATIHQVAIIVNCLTCFFDKYVHTDVTVSFPKYKYLSKFPEVTRFLCERKVEDIAFPGCCVYYLQCFDDFVRNEDN